MRGPAEDGVNGVPAHPEKGSMRGPAEDGVNGVLAQRCAARAQNVSGCFDENLAKKEKPRFSSNHPSGKSVTVRATHSHPFLRFNFLFSF